MGVWGEEEIEVDLTAGRIAVRGPWEFVSEIDWPRVEAVALLLARAVGPVDALKVAVWREYRGWRRRAAAKVRCQASDARRQAPDARRHAAEQATMEAGCR